MILMISGRIKLSIKTNNGIIMCQCGTKLKDDGKDHSH